MTSPAADLDRAVRLLRDGRLVAFPTETVYGLGADATNADAVARIFAAKGRPTTNPLIVHVSGVMAAKRFSARWPQAARKLAMAHWPGPLTLVLPKSPDIADNATAGRGTVGLRMPDHPLAIELLRKFDGALAAPSANRSNRISPTTAQHVRDEFGDAVDLVLDGGPCRVGIESTVLDLSGDLDGRPPRILRPGGVTREQIERVVGPVETLGEAAVVPPTEPAASPGQHAVHYAPRTPAYRFSPAQACRVPTENAAVLSIGDVPEPRAAGAFVTLPDEPDAYARHLYAALRDLDALGLPAIYVQAAPNDPRWTAVRDRLHRATRPMP